MESLKQKLRHGCPKRDICNMHRVDAKTCTHGPYRYCGKYRSMNKTKKQATLVPSFP